jgi:hypothetical protein
MLAAIRFGPLSISPRPLKGGRKGVLFMAFTSSMALFMALSQIDRLDARIKAASP